MGQSSCITDRQGNANDGKDSQGLIPALGPTRKASMVDGALIAHCESMRDAIALCVHLSRYPHGFIAETLGIDAGHWTRIMQGQAHFPPNKLVPLMELAGNLAPVQWLANACGLEVEDKAEAEVRMLRTKLEALEARRRAA